MGSDHPIEIVRSYTAALGDGAAIGVLSIGTIGMLRSKDSKRVLRSVASGEFL